MEVKDIRPNSGKIEVTLEVVRKESSRTFEKFGKKGKVCNALVKDESGEITLTLWNDDIEKVNVGDVIRLYNGWCSEFKGQKQLSTGKFGKIEVVEKGKPTVLTNDPSAFNVDDGDGDDDEGSGSDEEEENLEEEY